MIRKLTLWLPLLVGLMLTSCAGPERKLGRGVNNVTEVIRLGEMRRSIEQTALWDGPSEAFTTGLFRGFTRTMARTALGAYEVLTFPFPTYRPLFTPKYALYPDISVRNTRSYFGGLKLTEDPVYPASYQPNLISDQLFATDTSLGFSGGDVAPMILGSRFRIFDN